ncbi:MAG: hypothetical protein RR844_02930 [Clostridium sp.]|nr:hypothetical protein [Clostridium sp.]MDU7084120.1 hypothetical protein [Clostridium sp.]
MNLEDDKKLCEKAKQMLIDGQSYDEIRAETHLRLKDIKRIEREEVSSHF